MSDRDTTAFADSHRFAPHRWRAVRAAVSALGPPPGRLGTAGLALMAASQIPYPLLPQRRPLLSTLTVAGAFTGALAAAGRSWGWPRACRTAGIVVGGGLAAEAIGVRTGFPFGRYAYGPGLRPQVLGVPIAVPLAWFAIGAPAADVAGRVVTGPAARIALTAACMTAWDLFLDPQMTREGYWHWARRGRYRGIPASNYAGWLGVSAVLGSAVVRGADGRQEPWLLSLYIWTAAIEALGFLLFFGDPLVAVAGALAMGAPLALVAAGTRRRSAADRPIGGQCASAHA